MIIILQLSELSLMATMGNYTANELNKNVFRTKTAMLHFSKNETMCTYTILARLRRQEPLFRSSRHGPIRQKSNRIRHNGLAYRIN